MRKSVKEIFQAVVLGIGGAFMIMGAGGAYIGVKEQQNTGAAVTCAQQMEYGEPCTLRQVQVLAKAFNGSRTEATSYSYLAFGLSVFMMGTSRRWKT
ncbi:MAG: hypothetical protein ACAH83_15075 [Alphaproteobacteria bacterium]